MEAETIRAKRRRLPRWLRIALASSTLLLVAALALLWALRADIAADYIDRELARRGVQATYEVRRIGFGTQILENLAIGDPRNPDLTARQVRVQILIGFRGPYLGLITARGVRMRGRLVGGRVDLGQVNRLLPPPSGQPFRLPDQRVDLADARLDLATPAGAVALTLEGRGNLSDGFRGRLGLRSALLRLGECVLTGPVARLAIRVDRLRPRLEGPLAMRRAQCGAALAAERPAFVLRARLAQGLDGWRGTTVLRVAELRASGNRLTRVQGRLGFGGNSASTRGTLDVEAAAATNPSLGAGRTHFSGRYALGLDRGTFALQGSLDAAGVRASDTTLASLTASLRGARGTPLAPLGDSLAAAVVRAGRGGAEARAEVRLAIAGGGGRLRLGPMRLQSASGARLALAGGEGLSYAWPGGGLRLEGDLALSGGGFPDARFVLRRQGEAVRGSGRIAPMQAGGARLALGDIGFTAAPDGRTAFRTSATIDGPFGGGRVSGLSLPLTGRFGPGGIVLGEGCVTASFRALQLQDLRLGPTRLPLCPAGRAIFADGRFAAELRAPRLAGRLGSSPVTLAASRVRVDSAGFAASGVAVRLGPNRLDIATLGGSFGGRSAGGSFAGLSGDLANVPLLVGEGSGTWRMPGGDLVLAGRITVSDRQQPVRFHPLASEDFRLTLIDGRLRADGTLSHPASGTRVARAAIEHDLASGAGHADLEVDELRFAQGGLQPDTLTPLSVGVVALVDGSLGGEGRIEWSGGATRSTGRFATADMDLAAPFGPVEGLATELRFTDLLGLTSAPGQEARIRLIRAGIDVHDGVVRYQLRPNYHVAVETARWPLAGGTLTLEPTILDFSQESVKYLTFRIEGLDAARFIQQMEFSNIAATGTFDGTVPMEFGNRGGRVLGGRLVARDGGGTLSYIGEITNEDLGVYGALAFDALKSMRYNRMTISVDGALDGEFLTRIDMDGIARDIANTRAPQGGIAGMVVGRVLNQVSRIPFHFNISIQGPFRTLVATGRSFSDPSDLIRAALPGLLDREAAPDNAVQPQESEPVQ